MNKFQNDSETLSLQNAAYQAAEEESSVCKRYLNGDATEAEYCNAMDNTVIAVQRAIAKGVSRKDLPAV